MSLKEKIKQGVASDWFIALILLLIFLGAKGYKYAWDDQHLEIPLLKSLIDPTLYPGDYYIEGLKTNFISYFYVILARFINVAQIPNAYLVLYLISKYSLFFWVYKLWHFISKQKSVGFICTIVFMFLGRVPEFHYRTFSHQEFALAIVAAGIYYFYRERFILASLILGVASNFHFIYAAIPMAYLTAYLILQWKNSKWSTLMKSLGVFLLSALPIFIWAFRKNLPTYGTVEGENLGINWIDLYKIACPQNFIFFGISFKYIFAHFKAWFSVMQSYFLLIVLFAFNCFYNIPFKTNKKNHVIFFTAAGLLVLSYIFTYIKPTRFVLDLNLVRNTQFLFFILMGYTTIFITELIDRKKTFTAYYAALMFSFISLNDSMAILAVVFLSAFIFLEKAYTLKPIILRKLTVALIVFITLASLLTMARLISQFDGQVQKIVLAIFLLVSIAFLVSKFKPQILSTPLRRGLIILPLTVLCFYNFYYHYTRINSETKEGGFWKLQRDWEEMQRFVQKNTPKNATLLAPYDMEMGGFRIFSERKIICCYRDCGIIGFNYQAALEWLKRLHDIEAFKVILDKDSDLTPAILKAIIKYKADYIVFMRYYAPQENFSNPYEKIYQNDSFSLFKVKPGI